MANKIIAYCSSIRTFTGLQQYKLIYGVTVLFLLLVFGMFRPPYSGHGLAVSVVIFRLFLINSVFILFLFFLHVN